MQFEYMQLYITYRGYWNEDSSKQLSRYCDTKVNRIIMKSQLHLLSGAESLQGW
jgi:hypothetical protein